MRVRKRAHRSVLSSELLRCDLGRGVNNLVKSDPCAKARAGCVSSERKVTVSGLDPTWSALVAASDLNSKETTWQAKSFWTQCSIR